MLSKYAIRDMIPRDVVFCAIVEGLSKQGMLKYYRWYAIAYMVGLIFCRKQQTGGVYGFQFLNIKRQMNVWTLCIGLAMSIVVPCVNVEH